MNEKNTGERLPLYGDEEAVVSSDLLQSSGMNKCRKISRISKCHTINKYVGYVRIINCIKVAELKNIQENSVYKQMPMGNNISNK